MEESGIRNSFLKGKKGKIDTVEWRTKGLGKRPY